MFVLERCVASKDSRDAGYEYTTVIGHSKSDTRLKALASYLTTLHDKVYASAKKIETEEYEAYYRIPSSLRSSNDPHWVKCLENIQSRIEYELYCELALIRLSDAEYVYARHQKVRYAVREVLLGKEL